MFMVTMTIMSASAEDIWKNINNLWQSAENERGKDVTNN